MDGEEYQHIDNKKMKKTKRQHVKSMKKNQKKMKDKNEY